MTHTGRHPTKCYNGTMKQFTLSMLGMCALAAWSVLPAAAQDAAAKPAEPAKPPTFKEMFLFQLKDVETKLTGIADATPADKFGYRPAPGVRSTSEVLMHVAGANYFFMTFLGVKPPSGVNPMALEKTVTEKDKAAAALKASFEHVRNTVSGLSDADFSKETKMFGRTVTYEGALFFMANHMHEHLGQAIAYARASGVTPPWSKKEN
jgi:uncharacterized damage-inducible protein DinB